MVTEVMYHPPGLSAATEDEKLEFIELYNNEPVSADLGGWAFTKGISYVFEPNTLLGPKQYLVVARDPNALKAAYKITNVVGPYTGKLDNAGERVELCNAGGGVMLTFKYGTTHPWPVSPDGTGHSLVLAKLGGDPDEAGSWAASSAIGGTPGSPDPIQPGGSGAATTRVLINELLGTNGSTPGWIELYNPGPAAIDLSTVYLSNDRFNLLMYKIPTGTVLQPGGFWAVGQGTTAGALPFAITLTGGTVYVTAASTAAKPVATRVLDAVHYDSLEPGVTFGRYPDGSPWLDNLFPSTFAKPNAPRLIRDIVINEIMYHHPSDNDGYQYIELYNRGTSTIALGGWSFTSGITYTFAPSVTMPPGAFLVVAKDPSLLAATYKNLVLGANLVGPWTGALGHHREHIRLSLPLQQTNPKTGKLESYLVMADEVTYYDGGQWPIWADGKGASLELRDPRGNNDTPGAWAASDESSKTHWEQFSYTVDAADTRYTHDAVTVFDFMLLNEGEVLVDDLELVIGGTNRLTNGGFESGTSSWRLLGNHTRSFVSTEDHHSGTQCLHLIATGHGDPGANRINQSITSVSGGTVTLRGWARWLRGNRFLLLRTAREKAPIMPPRPACPFELDTPVDLGTPGRPNTAFVLNRGPDILEVQHAPVLPAANQPIVVTARAIDNDGVKSVTLYYRSEGTTTFTSVPMTDSGTGGDKIAGDGIYSATIPGAAAGTMRAFYITASDGAVSTRFPTRLEASAEVPDRTCLVRVGDGAASTRVNTFRIWMSTDVVNVIHARANLSDELMDCTFVYNDTDVFYNAALRFHGSPFLRSGSGQYPYDNHSYRVEFNSDQYYRGRSGFNLVSPSDEGGPLRERASYWFCAHLGLPYSTLEWIRAIFNGHTYNGFYDIQQIDGDYVKAWFPDNAEGFLHKIDDYFEYTVDGTGYANLDEGLRADAQHPPIPETYRWHFEKRTHSEEDYWQPLFDFAVALNVASTNPGYEQSIESKIDPRLLHGGAGGPPCRRRLGQLRVHPRQEQQLLLCPAGGQMVSAALGLQHVARRQ